MSNCLLTMKKDIIEMLEYCAEKQLLSANKNDQIHKF